MLMTAELLDRRCLKKRKEKSGRRNGKSWNKKKKKFKGCLSLRLKKTRKSRCAQKRSGVKPPKSQASRTWFALFGSSCLRARAEITSHSGARVGGQS